MTRRTLAYLAPALILAGAILLATFAPKARAAMEGLVEAERYPPTHQLKECRPGEICKVRGRPMGETACLLDAASLASVAPKATVIKCERVKP